MPSRLEVMYRLRSFLYFLFGLCAILAIYFLVTEKFWLQVGFWIASFLAKIIADRIRVEKKVSRFPREFIQIKRR